MTKPHPIRIESGIPIPPRYRWREMVKKLKPGQSFLVKTYTHQQGVLRAARDQEIGMVTRKINGAGIRCWRTD